MPGLFLFFFQSSPDCSEDALLIFWQPISDFILNSKLKTYVTVRKLPLACKVFIIFRQTICCKCTYLHVYKYLDMFGKFLLFQPYSCTDVGTLLVLASQNILIAQTFTQDRSVFRVYPVYPECWWVMWKHETSEENGQSWEETQITTLYSHAEQKRISECTLN